MLNAYLSCKHPCSVHPTRQHLRRIYAAILFLVVACRYKEEGVCSQSHSQNEDHKEHAIPVLWQMCCVTVQQDITDMLMSKVKTIDFLLTACNSTKRHKQIWILDTQPMHVAIGQSTGGTETPLTCLRLQRRNKSCRNAMQDSLASNTYMKQCTSIPVHPH